MPTFRPCVWQPLGSPETAALAADFYATQRHFIDHLAPVYLAMETRGRFCVPDALRDHAAARGIASSPEAALSAGRGPIVTAAYGDLKRCTNAKRHLVLFEHGAGFSFSNAHPSYSGGAHLRKHVSLFCEVNDWTAQRNRARHPGCRSVIVGSPKMDSLVSLAKREDNLSPTVCVSFHWDCLVAPETRSAFAHYAAALPDLARAFDLIVHAHPRVEAQAREFAERLGVEFVADFEDVCRRADLYVNDCSSTLYEFAALGRPVVVLNAPWYRRNVQHGLRFWDYADVGVQVDEPQCLVSAVEYALCDPPSQRERREIAVDEVYPYPGEAAKRAAALLDDFPAVLAGRVKPMRVALPQSQARRGALYVAIGDAARERAERSAASLREWHDLPVAVVSDGPCPWADEVLPERSRGTCGRWYKVRGYDLSPWEQTLMLDADTEIVGPLAHGFSALDDGWEVAVAQDYWPTYGEMLPEAPDAGEAERVAAMLPTTDLAYFNSGVVFFRRSEGARRLFARWRSEWEVGGGFDQPALAAAFYAMPEPPRLWLLSQRYNSNLPGVAEAVYHEHHTLPEVSHA